jgi:uncharacterized protein (DUF362 family)
MSDTTNRFQPQRVAAFQGAAGYAEVGAVAALVERCLTALALPADFVRPGDHVVLKPNWVKEHDERQPGPGHWEHVVTHPAVIEAVIGWVVPRLAGRGTLTVCDAPQTDSSFARLREYCRLDRMIERCGRAFPGLRFELLDLRPEEWETIDGVTVSRRPLPGDPKGSTLVRLNEASEFVGYPGLGRLYGASYDMAETNHHHHGASHEYLLCRTPMDADVFINLPKLKTHKKVGVTCALKNLVGINANKNWLPHHTEGTPDQAGDQFPAATARTSLERSWMGAVKRRLKDRPGLSRLFVPLKKAGRLVFGDTQKVVRSGNWHGNDTCWRMVLDLNRCLFLFDGAGQRRTRPLRYLALVDGIVGGEGNGPMSPDPKPCGLMMAGIHPVAVDAVAATLMGFDRRRLRLLEGGFAPGAREWVPFGADELEVVSDRREWNGNLAQARDVFQFRPHFGWVGSVESARPVRTGS